MFLGGSAALLAAGAYAWPLQSENLLTLWICVVGSLSGFFITWVAFYGEDLLEDSLAIVGGLGLCAIAAAAVLGLSMLMAGREQAMQDRDVVEQAVVVAGHVRSVLSQEGTWGEDYSYTLRATAGPLIRPDLDTGPAQLTIGSHLMVLADPRGHLPPLIGTRLSSRPWRVAGIVAGGIGAACLAVAAWAVSGGTDP